MSAGELDIALLPIIELSNLPDCEVVPGIGITTQGAARSVVLVSTKPLGEVNRVALDGESRTSNVLARVLFAEVWGRDPVFALGPLDLAQALREHDAAVRIGDKALFEPVPARAQVHDMGQVWTEATGLPFVFATWTARAGTVDREVYQLLHASRREGLKVIERIANEFSWHGIRDPERVRNYLLDHIHYRLGAAELSSMRRFFDAAARLQLISRPPEIRMALERRTACHDAATRPVTGRA